MNRLMESGDISDPDGKWQFPLVKSEFKKYIALVNCQFFCLFQIINEGRSQEKTGFQNFTLRF